MRNTNEGITLLTKTADTVGDFHGCSSCQARQICVGIVRSWCVLNPGIWIGFRSDRGKVYSCDVQPRATQSAERKNKLAWVKGASGKGTTTEDSQRQREGRDR